MEEFIKKWQKDKKYRAKIKLILYLVFFIIVTIYAITLNKSTTKNLETNNETTQTQDEVIEISDNYKYSATITYNQKEYTYIISKDLNRITITKENDDIINHYIKENNSYYKQENNEYILTQEEEIYEDIINKNYIDLTYINNYLKKSQHNNYQYLIYLKDIILDLNSEEYFVVLINDNKISIDYTPLIKHFNNTIKEYKVNIIID